MNTWRTETTENLFNAFLQLKTTDEAAAFCRDLMTEPEISEFAGRFAAATLLNQDMPQRQVSKATGVSIATVTRVNQWLRRGMNGYKLVLSRLAQTHNHPHRG